jgi:hypothetical protein
VDLGTMSSAQSKKLLDDLSGRGSGGADVHVRQVVRQKPSAAAPPRTTSSPTWLVVAAFLAVILALGAVLPLTIRRRQSG